MCGLASKALKAVFTLVIPQVCRAHAEECGTQSHMEQQVQVHTCLLMPCLFWHVGAGLPWDALCLFFETGPAPEPRVCWLAVSL